MTVLIRLFICLYGPMTVQCCPMTCLAGLVGELRTVGTGGSGERDRHSGALKNNLTAWPGINFRKSHYRRVPAVIYQNKTSRGKLPLTAFGLTQEIIQPDDARRRFEPPVKLGLSIFELTIGCQVSAHSCKAHFFWRP